MNGSHKLKRTFLLTLLAVLCILFVAITTTFAWYIYTVKSHTTSLQMAAGTNVTLQISNAADGDFSSSVELEEFQGVLNPVSTDSISEGFQKVLGYTSVNGTPSLLAETFQKSMDLDKDYYTTSLYFRTNGDPLGVYVSDIGYQDDDAENPISTAIRIGFVVPSTGEQFIFAINDASNPNAEYNTATGSEGYVLDASLTDGTTVPFTPYTAENWCNYDSATGAVSLKENSVPLCTVSGGSSGFGEAVQVNVYIWLEGCDEDCTNNLGAKTLQEVALHFAGCEVE